MSDNSAVRQALIGPIAVALLLTTIAYRFLSMGGSLGGFEDDEFVTLAYGQQIAGGDVPVRDFVENGSPLTHYLTAAAIRQIGPPLLGEALLTMVMLGLCTAVLFVLAERISGSIPIALTVALLQIAMAPRFYNYPKLLAYAIAIPAIWGYIARPERPRLFWIAVAGVLAFLLRHDHGGYVAVGGIAAVITAQWPDVRRAARETVLLGLFALALVSPYLIHVQRAVGVGAYLTSFLDFSGRSATNTNWKSVAFTFDTHGPLVERVPIAPPPPAINVRWMPDISDAQRMEAEEALGLTPLERLHDTTWKYALRATDAAALQTIARHPLVADTDGFDRSTFTLPAVKAQAPPASTTRILPGVLNQANALPFLYMLLVGIPLLALFGAIVQRHAIVGVTALIALLLDYGLLRGNLTSRLADVSEVVGVLAAWVAGAMLAGASGGRRAVISVALALVAILAALGIGAIEDIPTQIAQTRITSGWTATRVEARAVRDVLSGVPPVDAFPPGTPGIIGLSRYLHECTRPGDRILDLAYAAQVPVMAGRLFAGGVPWFLPRYFDTASDRVTMENQLRRHRAPIAIVVPASEYADFVQSFPEVTAQLASEYHTIGTYVVDARTQYRVFARNDLTATRTYSDPAWPCFN